ncbi:putative bifunctional diguanylate cyclase/phosphodiesterase [Nitratifractor sp.]
MDERIDQYTIDQLVLHSSRSILLLLFTSLFVALGLYYYQLVPPGTVIAWIVPLVFLLILRIWHIRRYIKKAATGETDSATLRKFYRVFFFFAMLSAFTVGISIPLFIPYIHNPYFTFALFIFIIGVAAGAMATLFPRMILAVSYSVILTTPLILFLSNLPDPSASIDALAVVLLVLTLMLIARTTWNYMDQVNRQKQALQFKEQELTALFEQAPTPTFYFDKDLRIRKYNREFQDFFEIPEEQPFYGFNLETLNHKEAIALMRRVLEEGKPLEYNGHYTATLSSKDYWLYAKISPLFDSAGKIIGGIASFQDKTMEVKSIEYLEELASMDPLTELGNRRSCIQTLHRQVERQNGKMISLLYFMDLDQFKPVNDTLGHSFGDQVLKKVAEVVNRLISEPAEVFRLGGDEFVILEPDCCENIQEAYEKGAAFAESINQHLEKDLIIDHYHLSLHTSIGIVAIPVHSTDPDEIIRYGDIAMYQAKSQKKTFAFYEEEMDARRRRNFFLRQGLNKPELLDQLELFFQPIYSIEKMELIGAEALLRWRHPTLGLLQPMEFIEIAVDNGDIHRIGIWIREEVCKLLAELRGKYETSLKFFTANVDPKEMGYDGFRETLVQTMKNYGIRPGELVLEITENSLVDNFEKLEESILALKRAGISWAVDDFGTGYSSLSYLEKLSFSILKIDQSFVSSLAQNQNTAFLVSHICQIATHLGYQIVAEGVENEEQVNKLRTIYPSMMCQGFHLAEPLSRKEFFDMISSDRSQHRLLQG